MTSSERSPVQRQPMRGLAILALIGAASTAFVGGGALRRVRPDPQDRVALLATSVAQPPTTTETEVDHRKSPFAQCLVEYKKPDGSLNGESYVFHMDAAFEDSKRAEKKPSFSRLLQKSSHIWGRATTVRCLPLNSLSGIGGPCMECVRLFVGGTYGGGVIVPAMDYSQINKTQWQPDECLRLRVFGQPPVGDDIAYTETGGGSMPGHEQRMTTFCRVASFPGLG
ncbi:unnamed protein product [Symbiodinium sp. CCMP2592]|nr:unnamed protein product [Symbiodinium sp. CCMP2592]